MKSLMMMTVAALALTAAAQEPVADGKIQRSRSSRSMMMDAGPGMRAMNPIMRIALNPKSAEKLGLSDEQKAKLRELRDRREDSKSLYDKVRKGMERQSELLKAEKIDEAAVMTAIDEVFEARKELAKQQTRRLISVKSVLTPEQVKLAGELLKAERGSRGHRGQKGPAKPDQSNSEKPKE